MPSAQNKPYIDKCIVSFSHNCFENRREADQLSLEKARREIAQGKNGISHLILRAWDDDVDRLKFLFLLNGIPVMCYSLANLLLSSLSEVVVVGSPEVGQVLEAFLKSVGTLGKRIEFVPENRDQLTMVSTLNLGRKPLSLRSNELVLFQPGDLPFMYDVEKVLKDADIEKNNLVLWLNSRQEMFPDFTSEPESEFVQRNYHYRLIDDEKKCLHDVKEPNTYPINLETLETDIIELVHAQRKDGQLINALFSKALTLPHRFLRMFPVLANHLMYFRSNLNQFRPNDTYQFGMHLNNFNRGAEILLNTPFRAKVHNDPAFVSDVDALEDWEDFEALIHHATKEFGEDGLCRIHPGGDLLLKFREDAMPALRESLPMYKDFPGYLNHIYESLEMGHVPYDSKGRYQNSAIPKSLIQSASNWYQDKAATHPKTLTA